MVTTTRHLQVEDALGIFSECRLRVIFYLLRHVSDASSMALHSINLTSTPSADRRRRNLQRFAAPDDQAFNVGRPYGLAARQILRGRQQQRLEAKRMTTRRFVSHENVSALLSKQSEVSWINCGIERRVGSIPILLLKSTAIHRLGLVFEVG